MKGLRYLVLGAAVLGVASVADLAHGEDDTLTPEQARVSRETKLAVERQMQLEQEAALAAPRPPKVNRGPSTPVAPSFPTGIFQTGQAPFSAKVFRIENQWQGTIGDEFVRVYAGVKADDTAQGVLVVLTSDARDLSDRTAQTGGVLLAPSRAGPLRIAEAEGTRLTVTNPAGEIFVFDVPMRSLVQTR